MKSDQDALIQSTNERGPKELASMLNREEWTRTDSDIPEKPDGFAKKVAESEQDCKGYGKIAFNHPPAHADRNRPWHGT